MKTNYTIIEQWAKSEKEKTENTFTTAMLLMPIVVAIIFWI